MPTLADIIRAEKTNVSEGDWKTGKIPNKVFPLIRGTRSIPVGPSWSWRMCEFQALGLHFRVLIRLNTDKERYHAILGFETDGQFRVICHHELHPPEKGWHCHFAAGNVFDVLPGVLRDRHRFKMREATPSEASLIKFTVDKANGLSLAAIRYRFQAQGELL